MAESAGLAVATVINKVSFVGNLPLLSQATTDDEKPTPGYMYPEINKISLESGAHCRGLLEYLTERIKIDSYHVKLKTVRIMKFLVINGHPEFRQSLRRNANGIRHATTYSGQPDPLHGMAPYAMVRKEAQELSQKLFDVSQHDSELPQEKPPMQNIGGMGSSGHGRMQGFGNQMPKPKSLGQSIMDSIVDIADKVLDPGVRPHPGMHAEKRFGDYRPVSVPDLEPLPAERQAPHAASMVTSASLIQSVNEGRHSHGMKSHKKGVPGGGWAEDEEEDVCDSGSSGYSRNDASYTEETCISERLELVKIDECAAERDALTNFMTNCSSDIPSRDDISSFICNSTSLNIDKTIEIISEKLAVDNTTNTQILGLLLIIESIMRTDMVLFDQLAFTLHKPLLSLFTTREGVVHQKSRKVIRILERLSTRSDLFLDAKPVSNSSSEGATSLKLSAVSSDSSAPATCTLLGGEQSPDDLPPLHIPFSNKPTAATSHDGHGDGEAQAETAENSSKSTFSFLNAATE